MAGYNTPFMYGQRPLQFNFKENKGNDCGKMKEKLSDFELERKH